MRNGGLLLLGTTVLLLAPTFDATAGDIQMEGLLAPFSDWGACDWGQTHLLSDPCTGDTAFVYTYATSYDCSYVSVYGNEITLPVYCFPRLAIGAELIHFATPPCLLQIRGVTISPISGGHRISWDYFGCAESHDVIRGTVANLTTQNLGAVTCVANDEPLNLYDMLTEEEPLPGECFFYLVRPNGTNGYPHYGHSSSESWRVPASGNCPTDPG